MIVATTANRPPVARAGSDDRTLEVGNKVQLDATDSADANGQLLGYAWTLTKKPSGSTAPLTNPLTPRPTFTADRKGKYTFSLVTTDAATLTASDTRLFSAPLPELRRVPIRSWRWAPPSRSTAADRRTLGKLPGIGGAGIDWQARGQ